MTISTMLRPLVLLAAASLTGVAAASAQPAAPSFDALAGQLQVGQLVWVTDPTGRETRGRLEQLSSEGLVLRANGPESFAVADVRRLRARDHDSIKNGALIGLGIGAGLATAWCIGAVADDSGNVDAQVECAEGFIVFPGLGALLGLAVDRLIPGTMRVVYQRSVPDAARGNLTVGPIISARAKGLAVSFAF